MADTLRPSTTRCPPLRQARGTVLNTIIEDTRESPRAAKSSGSPVSSKPQSAARSPQLQLKTSESSGSTHARLPRLVSPLSAETTSSCSDTEWQRQMQGFDDLYDATDDEHLDDDTETEISDACFSSPSTRPSSLVTPITRNSVTSTGSRKRSLSLEMPSSPTVQPSKNGTFKSSPVPPTPPPKIPVSPEALSMLARAVPTSHAPPSLDGSLSSDQESNISALATPDSHSLSDAKWDVQNVHVRPDLDGKESADLESDDAGSDLQAVPIRIESPQEDWRDVLGRFPKLPTDAQNNSSLSLHLSDEPTRESTASDGGVCLPDDALAMLLHIPLDGTPESASETTEGHDEMRQLQVPPSRPRSADGVTPASDLSGHSFSNLSIPSPGGFFASLGAHARHTWTVPNTNYTPSSAVAEGFYNLPWPQDGGEIVEQVIDWPERESGEVLITAVRDQGGPPTAIRLPCETPTRPVAHQQSPTTVTGEVVRETTRTSDGHEYDELYDQELQKRAAASLDRTSTWLAAQESYLAALSETNPVNEICSNRDGPDAAEDQSREAEPEASRKKAVRFADGIPQGLSAGSPTSASSDSIYWRGFQSIRCRSGKADGFLHRNMRFDAVQSIRLGLVDLHLNCLMGKYELVRSERPPYKGPFAQAPRNSVLTSVLAEKAQFAKIEQEQLALAQLCQPVWAMDALRYLNGGSLLASPARRQLACTRAQRNALEGPPRRSIRILDLGGHPSCEWGWYAAHEFPNAKVYTVVTKHQLANRGIIGPPNHRLVTVSHLWKLPFGENRFDVISARSLPALLRSECPMGLDRDEYDLVLSECLRCLKPGGSLEFLVLDAEISRAGPYATATSVEFAFNLRTRGYDPVPSRRFLARLHKGGFVGTKRAWMFLPAGVGSVEPQTQRQIPTPRISSQMEGSEAVHGPVGSTMDIASVTGLLGGWMWEQWLLKLQMEMGRERKKLLEGVGVVFDESRKAGAGWTCLTGWAMKSKRPSQVDSSRVAGTI